MNLVANNKIPQFETPRLILKKISLEDASSYQKYFNDYEIIGHLAAHVPWPYPEDGAYQFIKNVIIPKSGQNQWMWGIFLSSNRNNLIGVIDLYRTDALDNRGFWLAKDYWGQGLMIEALTPITDYAFNELNFSELKLSNALGNISSRRIKEKQGARFVGIRNAKFVNPKYTQAEDWILTKSDWENKKHESINLTT